MKYYYTDPLAAAWMAKHFGMKFVNDDFRSACEVAQTEQKEMPFVISKGSLHLLEPKVGDLIFCAGNDGDPDLAVEFGDPHLDPANDKEIIQRNGLQFMWPEKED